MRDCLLLMNHTGRSQQGRCDHIILFSLISLYCKWHHTAHTALTMCGALLSTAVRERPTERLLSLSFPSLYDIAVAIFNTSEPLRPLGPSLAELEESS